MFRFTIRDVLWLTVVVGLALTLLSEHRQRLIETAYLKEQLAEERAQSKQWQNTATAQLKAFQLEQSTMVHAMDAIQRKLQESNESIYKSELNKRAKTQFLWPFPK